MKELTFREVIDRKIDKEYEIWEGEFVVVTIFQNNRISVVNKVDGITILEDDLFRLKRQEYSFQEAFEAFENGEEIESVENNWKWKKDGLICLSTPYGGESFETSCDRIFSVDEIKGKWYINK